MILDISKSYTNVSFRVLYLGSLQQKNNIEICHETISEIPTGRVSLDLDCSPIPFKKINSDVYLNDDGKHNFENLEERLNIPLDELFGNTSIVISGCVNNQEFLRVGFIVNVQYPNIPNSILEQFVVEDSQTNSNDSNEEDHSDDQEEEEDNSDDQEEGGEEEEEGIVQKKSKLDVDHEDLDIQRNDQGDHDDGKKEGNGQIDEEEVEEDLDEEGEENSENNSKNIENNSESQESQDSDTTICEEFTYTQLPIKEIPSTDRFPYLSYVLNISEIFYTISEKRIETYFDIEDSTDSSDYLLASDSDEVVGEVDGDVGEVDGDVGEVDGDVGEVDGDVYGSEEDREDLSEDRDEE